MTTLASSLNKTAKNQIKLVQLIITPQFFNMQMKKKDERILHRICLQYR